MDYKEVQYRVTNDFGILEEGAIINALLVVKEGYNGLLYHPHTRGECPSFELAIEVSKGLWETLNEQSFINIPKNYRKFEESLFGKDFKFERKIFAE